jgi:AcrR family transcriptional regulator
MATATRTRQSSDLRRDQVLDAATHEFARHGYHAASTASIAKLAGISQPYIYALFPNKRELFLAAHARVIDRLRSAFIDAARGGNSPEERLCLMGQVYRPLLEADRDALLLQMQGHAAGGDPEIGPAAAAAFRDLFAEVRRASGASDREVAEFFACGMLINVTTALGLTDLAAPLLDEPDAADAADS